VDDLIKQALRKGAQLRNFPYTTCSMPKRAGIKA